MREKNGIRIYGSWAGKPEGNPENKENCIEEIFGGRWVPYQCSRKRGQGLDGLYCKQHAKSHPSTKE